MCWCAAVDNNNGAVITKIAKVAVISISYAHQPYNSLSNCSYTTLLKNSTNFLNVYIQILATPWYQDAFIDTNTIFVPPL